MKLAIKFLLLLFSIQSSLICRSQHITKVDTLKAGTKISEIEIEDTGLDNYFNINSIDEGIFNRIYDKSYKNDCTIHLDELKYLKILHVNMYGEIIVGELICNKEISNDLISIFKTLYIYKYPIEKVLLIDVYDAEDNLSTADNNSSAFNFRYISGTKRLSNHSWGMAIDINPLYNPYVKTTDKGTIIIPEEGSQYADRSIDHPYMIKFGDICYNEFIKHGFIWGGRWRSAKDYQHFEKSR